ncbi:hypothetical protein GDO86_005479 [Hymenochirus boettgeri]|uniref:Uncharacterized protein n=1 Tax=Hymenochirus boettgeri TaxID=247094 RepID=A0A8T2J215_9PIPI|nr:hypothetical protein GDO86_005479 [Hymenochirus boettgeri]
MAEQAVYPAIALAYFALLSWESRGHGLELGTAASINVFCLFVFAQPLCLLIGGYPGVGLYLLTAIASYVTLPRGEKPKQEDKDEQEMESSEKLYVNGQKEESTHRKNSKNPGKKNGGDEEKRNLTKTDKKKCKKMQ